MNNNETQLLNSMLALAALSANISPEELKEYVNVLSPTRIKDVYLRTSKASLQSFA